MCMFYALNFNWDVNHYSMLVCNSISMKYFTLQSISYANNPLCNILTFYIHEAGTLWRVPSFAVHQFVRQAVLVSSKLSVGESLPRPRTLLGLLLIPIAMKFQSGREEQCCRKSSYILLERVAFYSKYLQTLISVSFFVVWWNLSTVTQVPQAIKDIELHR